MTTRNRGKEGSDDRLFGDPQMQHKITEATKDMCYLLTRGFAEKSSLQIVGNRYKLNTRQQKALLGMSASEQSIQSRKEQSVTIQELKDETIAIDGFNLLILLESILSGAYIFKGLDGFYRDIGSVHGSYKRVQKTEEAIILVGQILNQLKVREVLWFFDAPVSNSGRLKTLLGQLAQVHQFSWQIHLDNNPDQVLAQCNHIVITSDAWILDRAKRNFNLPNFLIGEKIASINLISTE